MDNQRIFVWAALALVLWLNYTDVATRLRAAARTALPLRSRRRRRQCNAAGHAAGSCPPTLQLPTPQARRRRRAPAPAATASRLRTASAGVVHVTTDVLSMDISTRGGELVRADLLKYPLVKNQPNVPVRLFNPTAAGLRRALRTARGRQQARAESPRDLSQRRERVPAEGRRERSWSVPLTWSEGGLTVTKTYTFHPGSYRIDLTYDVSNQSGSDWKAASYVQLVRHYEHVERSYFKVETYAYRGPAIYDGKGYRKLNVEKEEDRAFKGSYRRRLDRGAAASLRRRRRAARRKRRTTTSSASIRSNDFTLSLSRAAA